MGSHDSLISIIIEIKTYKSIGMTTEEIVISLEDDGVEPKYIAAAMKRANTN